MPSGWAMPHLTCRIEHDGNKLALWELNDEGNRSEKICAKLPLKDKKRLYSKQNLTETWLPTLTHLKKDYVTPKGKETEL